MGRTRGNWFSQELQPRRVLFLGKNATRGGGQRFLYNVLCHLHSERFAATIVLPEGGDLLADYQAHATVSVFGNERSVRLLRAVQQVCRAKVLRPIAHAAHAIETRFRGRWMRRELANAKPDVIVHVYTLPEPLFDGIDRAVAPSAQCLFQYAETLNRMGDVQLGRFTQRAHFFFAEGTRVQRYAHDCLGIPQDRILLIPVGPETARREAQLRNPDRTQRADLGIAKDELIVGACGGINYKKGVDLWVRAADLVFRRFPDRQIRFLWIGGNDSAWRSPYGRSIASLTAELGYGTRIIFSGDHKDVYPILDLCDIFVQPSRNDAFPQTVMEAMSLGKPVVTFAEGIGSEAYAKDAVLSVPIMSAEALAGVIAQLIEHPEMRQHLGEAAGCLIREQFNIIENVRRFENALDQVIREAPLPGIHL